MALWVPPRVERKLVEERNAYTASIESMVERFRGVMADLNPKLKEIDPYLELIFAPPNASAAGLTPGRYHLMRHNPGAPPSLMVIEDEQGRFMEPGSRLLDEVRSRDLWSDGAVEARRQARLEAERRAVAAKERENEERRADLQERWDAVSRTQVSMNRDAAWTQNASPAARRDAQSRRR